jgi:hypothetical protein
VLAILEVRACRVAVFSAATPIASPPLQAAQGIPRKLENEAQDPRRRTVVLGGGRSEAHYYLFVRRF